MTDVQDCCSSGPTLETAAACPQCSRPGRKVERLTLKALLRPAALERLGPSDYRFCGTSACSIVYFSSHGDAFRTADLGVPVFQKEGVGARIVCYCRELDEAAVQRDHTGLTSRILELVAAGRCACELRNPQGSCCLGNVSEACRAVQHA